MTNRFDGADANGFVGRRNRWAQITTRWLEARERRSFAGAMDADQRLEEESVGQLSRLRAKQTNRERLLEGLRISGSSFSWIQISTSAGLRVSSARCAAFTTGPSRPSQCASARAGVSATNASPIAIAITRERLVVTTM
jgi:hypothetical protein